MKRKLFVSGRSLYVNIPKPLCDEACFTSHDEVDVRYVEGIGIIVSLPVRIPLSDSERIGGNSTNVGVSVHGRMMRSQDGKCLELIPLYDGWRRKE